MAVQAFIMRWELPSEERMSHRFILHKSCEEVLGVGPHESYHCYLQIIYITIFIGYCIYMQHWVD
jgi:hypothetical protein